MRLVEKNNQTKKLNAEQTAYLFSLIHRSVKADEKFWKRISVWKKAVQGKIMRLGKKQDFEVTINLAYSHLRSKLPTLFFREPTIVTTARNEKMKTAAPVWKKVLNSLNLRNGYKKETKRAVNDSIIASEGWKKIVVSTPDDVGSASAAIPGRKSTKPRDVEGGETTEAGSGPADWENKLIVASVWVPTTNVIVDYQTPGRDIYSGSCRFVAIRYLKNVDELKADPRYKIPEELHKEKFVFAKDGSETGYSNIRHSVKHLVELGNNPPDRAFMAQEDMTWIYEIWAYQIVANEPDVKMYKRMVVLMDGADVPIREPEDWSEYVGEEFPGWPIHKFELNEIPLDYAIGELEPWYPLLQAVNWVMSRAIEQLGSVNHLTVMDGNAVNNPAKVERSIKQGDPRTVIKIKSGKASEAINRLSPPPVQQDLFQILSPLISILERVSQSSRNRQSQAGIRTATEARNIEEFSQIVEGEQVDIIADFLKADNIKMATVIKQIADSGYISRLIGENGPISWDGDFDADNLKWLPEFDIEVDSFRQTSNDALSQKWQIILQNAIQLLPYIPKLRIDLITQKWIETLGVDSGEILGEIFDERLLQMVEITAMMNGQPVEISPQEDHRAHIEMLNSFENTQIFEGSSEEYKRAHFEHKDQHMEADDALQAQAAASGAAMQAQGAGAFDALQRPATSGISTPQEGLTGEQNA